jgi:hypothetical protein
VGIHPLEFRDGSFDGDYVSCVEFSREGMVRAAHWGNRQEGESESN